jgi:microcin C transport system substrate-binding protein
MKRALTMPYSIAAVLILTTACSSSPPESNADAGGSSTAVSSAATSTPDHEFPVFANPDAGADPSIPAEQGGRGFTGDGWDTNTTFAPIGDPRAVKGGVLRQAIGDFPATLRLGGPEWNTTLNYMIGNAVYETLLNVHPVTMEYIPAVATHWQMSPDRKSFRFRINPNARWSDGQPVVAEDVVASWRLYTDKGLNDPAMAAIFTRLEEPVADSKYLLSVRATNVDWKDFLSFATFLPIFPAHALKSMDGAIYVRDFNFKYLPSSGPYIIGESDVVKGQSITLRRRTDYWAQNDRRNVGLNNFDELRLIVVRDGNLSFELFKRGDLDTVGARGARMWAEELNFDTVQRGLIQKLEVTNNSPRGYNGFAINTRRPPFDDVRVRQALTLLFNREILIEKLAMNQNVPMTSYFSGTIYENPDNPRNQYDPERAMALLAEAGWKGRDARGRLVKDGRPLTFEMLYDSNGAETYLTIYQEELRMVGITMNLRLTTPSTRFQLMGDRRFDMVDTGWGGVVFPEPENAFHSRLADVPHTENVTGFKDPGIDELCRRYAESTSQAERIAIVKEIDAVLTSLHHYIFKWYSPFQRIAFWNRFGYPPGRITRIGLFRSDLTLGPGIERLWWVDPAKAGAVTRALADPAMKLPTDPVVNRYWEEFAQ